MHQPELNIRATYERKHLNWVYFKNGQGNFWLRPGIPKIVLIIVVFFAAVPFLMIIGQEKQIPILVVASVMSLIIGIVVLIHLLRHAWIFFRWKYSVNAFIRQLADTSETINCTDNAITFITEKETSITRWEEVHQVTITDDLLSLYAGKNLYLLPAASIDPE